MSGNSFPDQLENSTLSFLLNSINRYTARYCQINSNKMPCQGKKALFINFFVAIMPAKYRQTGFRP
jgi:hypothetical protein